MLNEPKPSKRTIEANFNANSLKAKQGVRMRFKFRGVKVVILGALLLSGCAPGPMLKFNTELINAGNELDPGMVNVNFIATVGYDETHLKNLPLQGRGVAYLAGATDISPEYQYRAVYLNIRILKGFMFLEGGGTSYPTVGMVPDGMPALKAWDLVELRQTGTYDTVKNFSKTGEGNAVLRVLCRRADPAYEKCVEALPRIGKHKGQGLTNTEYPASLKSYGFSFSPAYAKDGSALRALP
jgi:hypothetical protein